MTRPSWDETWMRVARAVADRSRCDKRKVGAVVVSADCREHWVGYNGPPSGLQVTSSCKNWCPQGMGDGDSCVAVHAEINALLQSPRLGRLGGTFYSTLMPCLKCASAIANSGVVRVVTVLPPRDEARQHINTLVLFEQSGIELVFDYETV